MNFAALERKVSGTCLLVENGLQVVPILAEAA
jgi:hypothetical protein